MAVSLKDTFLFLETQIVLDEMLVLKPSEPGMLLDLPLDESQHHHPNSIETEYKLRMTRSFADDEIRARFKGNLVDRYTI